MLLLEFHSWVLLLEYYFNGVLLLESYSIDVTREVLLQGNTHGVLLMGYYAMDVIFVLL